MSLLTRSVASARLRSIAFQSKRSESTGAYQPPSPPSPGGQSNPHGAFYKTFGRPVIKNFLIAMLTYQAIYFTWAKLENMEIKKTKSSEIKQLEGEIRNLTIGRKTT